MQNSKSTDKLIILTKALKRIPKEKIMKVKEFSLTWETMNSSEQIVVPNIKFTF